MVHLVARRVGSSLVTLWLTLSLTFFIIHILPGDPVMGALSQSTASVATINQREAALHLDQPLVSQYFLYFSDLMQFKFGVSWSGGMPVADMIKAAFPHTLTLAVASFSIALIGGLALGIPLGLKKRFSVLLTPIISLSLGTPVIFFGTLAILFFSVWTRLLPSSGQGALSYLILPAITIGFSQIGVIAKWVEEGVRQNSTASYVLLGKAKGVKEHMVLLKYILRISLLPLIDSSTMLLAYLLSGAVVSEVLFARSGLGKLLVRAVLDQDIPVLQAVVAVSALFFTAATLTSDIAHAALDPRLRSGIETPSE